MQKRTNGTLSILERAINSKLFAILCPVLTIIIAAFATLVKKNWTWVVVSVFVVVLLLLVLLILSAQIAKANRDIVDDLIKDNGILDEYLLAKVEVLSNSIERSGACMTDVQRECRKSIEQYFLEQYSKINFLDIDEILALEKEQNNKEIWIISDELSTDIDNEKVMNIVGQNLQSGTLYKYFYTKIDRGLDAEKRMKSTFASGFQIEDIGKVMSFNQVGDRYDALVKIAKDIIILNPDGPNRRAFVCIYSNTNFEIAFYRELDVGESSDLCGMILRGMLVEA